MKRRSEEITGRKDGAKWVERTAARTMLRAVRFTDEDFEVLLAMITFGYSVTLSRRPSKTPAARRLSLALRSSLMASPWAPKR
jgi:hypothetical protein